MVYSAITMGSIFLIHAAHTSSFVMAPAVRVPAPSPWVMLVEEFVYPAHVVDFIAGCTLVFATNVTSPTRTYFIVFGKAATPAFAY